MYSRAVEVVDSLFEAHSERLDFASGVVNFDASSVVHGTEAPAPLSPYNMSGANRKSVDFDAGGLTPSGLDTLYLNCHGYWSSREVFEATCELLHAAQAAAVDGDTAVVTLRDGTRAVVAASGVRKRNQFYRWRLRVRDVDLLIVERRTSTGAKHCGIYAEVGSVSCMALNNQ